MSVCVSQFRECCGLDCNVPHRSYFKCLFCSWWSYSVRPWNLLEVYCWMWAFESFLVQALGLVFLFLLAGLLCLKKNPRHDLADFLSTRKLSEVVSPNGSFPRTCHFAAVVQKSLTQREIQELQDLNDPQIHCQESWLKQNCSTLSFSNFLNFFFMVICFFHSFFKEVIEII